MKTSKQGYSLIELSLAILVATLGLMAAFGLFPEALRMSRAATEFTEMSMFADYVLDSLWVVATADFSKLAEQERVIPRTHALTNAVFRTDAFGGGLYVDAGAVRLYEWQPRYFGSEYGVTVEGYAAARFTYLLNIGSGGGMKYARLKVWPGDVVAAAAANHNLSGSVVFYRSYAPMQ
ncbi:MAG: hypothetical protein KA248_09455 [Kiritimatiellae bacterium]|nr:hypothetical protein [Kiritimatiellia bacterium]